MLAGSRWLLQPLLTGKSNGSRIQPVFTLFSRVTSRPCFAAACDTARRANEAYLSDRKRHRRAPSDFCRTLRRTAGGQLRIWPNKHYSRRPSNPIAARPRKNVRERLLEPRDAVSLPPLRALILAAPVCPNHRPRASLSRVSRDIL